MSSRSTTTWVKYTISYRRYTPCEASSCHPAHARGIGLGAKVGRGYIIVLGVSKLQIGHIDSDWTQVRPAVAQLGGACMSENLKRVLPFPFGRGGQLANYASSPLGAGEGDIRRYTTPCTPYVVYVRMYAALAAFPVSILER